jgi:hypothetical protein
MKRLMRRTSDQILIRRYLLGDLPEEERVRVEDQYLADGEVFEELLAIENDLIDAYVRGELTEDERKRFEIEYLTSLDRRNKVEFARALHHASALERQLAQTQVISLPKRVKAVFFAQRRIPQWALVAAVGLISASGSWLIIQNIRLRVDLQQALAAQASLRREEGALRQRIADQANPRYPVQESQQGSEIAKLETPGQMVETLRLNPGTVRSVGELQKTLTLLPTTSQVQIQLVLDRDEYPRYKAVLSTAEGKEVFREKSLQSSPIDRNPIHGGAMVAWRLPAHLIPPGDYIVLLTGQLANGNEEDVASYGFSVLRR